VRIVALALVAVLPMPLKRLAYRLQGFDVARSARVGASLLDVRHCRLGEGVVIGHGNAFVRVERLDMGDHASVGHLNIFRGGDEVRLERWSRVLRLNVINAIPDPILSGPADPRFRLGPGAVITAGHKIDFTDRVDIGRRAIIGGRGSSLWTHNRQQAGPLTVGDQAYVGSDCRMAPGASVPARSVVGMGAVVVGRLDQPAWLYGGVPAKPLKPLDDHDLVLVDRPTHEDLPADV
jgi:carbonic anhydrase/acetyltransferase-like protein (isoleucine patch superfamily)